jgi:hypothetical protein
MIVTLHTRGLQTLAQVQAFVSGNEPISFTLEDRQAAYGWMADTLGQCSHALQTCRQGRIAAVRKRYRYRDMMTHYEKLRSLPEAESYLKLETTLKKLDEIAAECSDNDAAQRLDEAKTKLFQFINKTRQRAA